MHHVRSCYTDMFGALRMLITENQQVIICEIYGYCTLYFHQWGHTVPQKWSQMIAVAPLVAGSSISPTSSMLIDGTRIKLKTQKYTSSEFSTKMFSASLDSSYHAGVCASHHFLKKCHFNSYLIILKWAFTSWWQLWLTVAEWRSCSNCILHLGIATPTTYMNLTDNNVI